KFSDSERICLITKNGKNELIIEDGVPQYTHGIGKKITPDIGETFLRQVMRKGRSLVLVTNPCKDQRVAYMRELVTTCGITAILFLPLYFEGEANGILVFDRVSGIKFTKEDIEKIRLFGRLASKAIGTERRRQKDREKILQDEKLRTLGEHSSQVAHIIRNSLTIIGGFSGRMLKSLSKESRSEMLLIESKYAETLADMAETIDYETKKLERIVNDILSFTGFKKPVFQPCNVNRFLEEEIPKMAPNGVRLKFKLSSQLNRVNVFLDRNMMSLCIQDLIRNAIEASATRVDVKTKLKPKQREVTISVINDGNLINTNIIKNIFSPFVTTKVDGSGLGLANVQSIVRRHHGDISVFSRDKTEFKICIPLIQLQSSQ
ncbi:MAG: ATP-binding protein, partial [Nitrospirota bacterium]